MSKWKRAWSGDIRDFIISRRTLLLIVVFTFGIFVFSATQAATVMPGATAGLFQVGADGAAEYFAPIQVPPGTGGLRPELSFHYNSRRGNGLIGMGWALKGLGAIARCPQTIIREKIKAKNGSGLKDEKKDASEIKAGFCLDGRILISLGKDRDASETEYKHEIDKGEKIVSHGVCGDGPCYFTLLDRKGNRRDFGRSKDARLKSPESDQIRVWGLSRITDRNGNYLRILYDKTRDNSQYYPREIRYTGNKATGLQPRRSVLFFYENRDDIINSLSDRVKITKRLNKVLTKVGENQVKEYRLAYESGPTTLRSRLSALKECDDVGNCLSPTVFEWENGRPELDEKKDGRKTPSDENIISLPRLMIDINGDGAPDYVYVLPDSGEYRVIFNEGNSFDMAKSRRLGRNLDALKTISNGVGGRVAVHYKQIDTLAGSPYVVSQHTLSDERGSSYTFERRYAGLKIDQHRDFVGFAEISVINRDADRETINTYHLEFPYSGMLKRKIERTLDKITVRRSAYFYNSRKHERGVWQVNLTAATESENLNQDARPGVRRLEYQYDDRGRPTLEFDSRKKTYSNEEIHTCRVYEDRAGEDWWKSWFATEEKSTRDRKTCQSAVFSSWKSGADISRRRFAYDSKMNIVSQKLWDDSKNKWIGAHFAYDAYGNLVRKVDPWRTILAITYDAEYHAFPIEKRINQFITTLRHEPKFGVKIRETDFNGNTMRWTPPVKIDGFGRVLETRVNRPEDKSEVVVRKTLFSGVENNNGLKITVHTRSDWNDENLENWIWETKYRDALGRVYKTENKTRDGQVIVRRKEFDPQGCVVKEAPPYYRPESRPFWNELRTGPAIIKKPGPCRGSGLESWVLGHEFSGPIPDLAEPNRIIGAAKNFSPSTRSDLEIRPDFENRSERRAGLADNIFDLIDRASKRELANVYLKHNSLGQIISIFKAGLKIASLSYTDGGRIKTSTDAKGQIIDFDYDSLGRVVEKRLFAAGDYPKNPEKTIVYVYDRGANALGKPTSVSAPEATVSFSYDRLGRIKSETMVISDAGGREFTVSHRRDPQGRPLETTYPDNSTIRRLYAPGGEIHKIQLKEADENIFGDCLTYGDRSPSADIGSFIYGNGLKFTRAYDSSGRLASVRATADGKSLLRREYFRSKAGRVVGVVDYSQGAPCLLNGAVVVAADSVDGLGYLMLSRGNIRQRFFIYPPHPENDDHFIAATYRDGKWKYNDGYSWRVFTPRKDDVLIAEADFGERRFVNLKGKSGNFGGIAYGYADGELAFYSNLWRSDSDKARFYLAGRVVVAPGGAKNGEVFNCSPGKRRELAEIPDDINRRKIKRDANGAVRAKGDFRYSYDIEGRLVKVEKKLGFGFKTVYEFTYGPLGARLCKTQSDGSKTFYPFSLYEASTSPLARNKYVKYIDGAIAVSKRESGEAEFRYFHRDSSGVVIVSDGKGRLIKPKSCEPHDAATRTGAAEDNFPPELGPVRDAKSGLYYWKGRYFDYETGRFLNFHFLSSPAPND